MKNEIKVKVKLLPKKNKKDNSVYNVYLRFTISQNGVTKFTPAISTPETVKVCDWDRGRIRGRNDTADMVNKRLVNYVATANDELLNLKFRGVKTCMDYKNEILTSIKTIITGKAPKGKKASYESIMADQTVHNVMLQYFKKSKPCKERQIRYEYAVGILTLFYKSELPLITDIDRKELENFKVWYEENYIDTCIHKQNTATTYLTMIAAIFLHAFKLNFINKFPLPENFRGSFVDANRAYLSQEQVFQIINLDDNILSFTEKKAKYCMLFQCLTGIGYGDMKELTREHTKYDTDLGQWVIKKKREKNKRIKSNPEFIVFLTSRAKSVYDKLRELCPGADTIFALPSIDYTNREYKEIARRADVQVEKIGTYTFRHTFAVDFMNNGGTLDDLAKILGHTTTKTTKIYGKISKERLHNATLQLEQRSRIHQMN